MKRFSREFIKQFITFSIVGTIGLFINLTIVFVLTEYFKFYYMISAIFAFMVAVTSNYLLNKTFTFKEKLNSKFTHKYIKFFGVSIIALCINLVFLYLITEFLHFYYLISQTISIGIAMLINFFGNKNWTFKK
jgi:putative flippase GtrA